SFFFSSRRRHTRFSRDWSSDVCSSDLCLLHRTLLTIETRQLISSGNKDRQEVCSVVFHVEQHANDTRTSERLLCRGHLPHAERKIGRASCRESAWSSVGAA